MKLIKGEQLTPAQAKQVRQAFIYRYHAIGEGKHYPNERAWLHDHSFYFTNSGKPAKKPNHCEPAWMADTRRTP